MPREFQHLVTLVLLVLLVIFKAFYYIPESILILLATLEYATVERLKTVTILVRA